MVCVFGESGSRPEIVVTEQASPLPEAKKQPDPPAKTTAKRKNSTPSRQTGGGKGLGSRHNSLNDVRDSGIGSVKTKQLSGKTPAKNTQALRASLQHADLTFSRSKTSDAILSRSRRRGIDSPGSVAKRRGNGNLSREPSSENLRTSRPKSAGMRRKSVGKRSPEIRRRSAVSPASARRKLEAEYDETAHKKSALRKDLNNNNLMFVRSFSADTITKGKFGSENFFCAFFFDMGGGGAKARQRHLPDSDFFKLYKIARLSVLSKIFTINPSSINSIMFSHLGRGARRQADMLQNSPTNLPLMKNYGSPSRIPMPVTTFGKPRGSNRTSVLNEGSSGTSEVNGGTLGTQNGVNNGSLGISNGGINRCIHCTGETCTCDEGFIDGEVTRTPLRPTSLFHNTPNELEYKNRDSNCTSNANWNGNDHLNYENSKFLEIPQQHNGDGFSGNSESLEWREVMTDILKYEENRISDKNL